MPSGETKPMKIQIIDDESSIVEYLEVLLTDNGYQTVSAADGVQGMEQTKSEMPDLICLDITMPEKSGIRFYRELRDDPELAHIPVVVVTAVTGYGGNSEQFRHFLDTRRQFPPPEEFIAKPIERDRFLATINRVLSAHASG